MLGIGRAGPLGPLGEHALDATPEPPGPPAAGGAPGHGSAARRPSGTPPSISEAEAWAVAGSISEIGPATLVALVGAFGSGRALVAAAAARDGEKALGRVLPRTVPRETARLLAARARESEAWVEAIRRLGLSVVISDDPDYPPSLRQIGLPPPVLFVAGDRAVLGAEPAVAVVGTRRPSEAGRRIASRLGAALARGGAVVVSGLAVGVDGATHAGVVEASGRTVAVLGGGHDRLYPAAHRRLAAEILACGGAIVSEFAPGTHPTRWSFPRRNRVISGLARATVVVEAGPRSGALITAMWALEQGRECFIVPGGLEDSASAGCLHFLRDHAGVARIVAGVPELLEDLGLGASRDGRAAAPVSAVATQLLDLPPTEGLVARLVTTGHATLDELVAGSGLATATVLAALTVLELRGLVVDALGRYRPTGRLAPDPRPVHAMVPSDPRIGGTARVRRW